MFITGIYSKSTLFRADTAFPPSGTCRQSNAEIIDLSIEDLKISSVLIQGPDTPVEHQLGFQSPHGRMHYSRKNKEHASWNFTPAFVDRRTLPTREKETWDLASPILATLADLCERLPEHHLPHLDQVTPEEQEMLRTELPARGDVTWPAPGRFDRGLLLMANRIAQARDIDRGTREKAERRKRLRKQFGLLPEGTVLVNRRGGDVGGHRLEPAGKSHETQPGEALCQRSWTHLPDRYRPPQSFLLRPGDTGTCREGRPRAVGT